MKTAAVSQLKTFLSGYLANVKAGEEIIVTDRGTPIARLVPINRDETSIPDRLLRLEKAGLIKIGTGRLPEDFWQRPKPKDDEDAVLKALQQEREEAR
ncbi:MAG: type II toxin-antitoxin system prevent-host-death family antitoxin [Syntrophales bacterium]|nr:type II toxin-antitoxin system prevent-host-death family antitoxin [Syntrophales bacterium]